MHWRKPTCSNQDPAKTRIEYFSKRIPQYRISSQQTCDVVSFSSISVSEKIRAQRSFKCLKLPTGMEPHTSCVCPQSTLSPWSSAVLPHHPPAPPTSWRLTVPFPRGYSTLSLHADRGELPEVLSWQSHLAFFSCSSGVNSLCGLRFIATKLPEEPPEKVAFHGLARENQPKRQTDKDT